MSVIVEHSNLFSLEKERSLLFYPKVPLMTLMAEPSKQVAASRKPNV